MNNIPARLLEEIIADAITRTGAERSAVKILLAEAVTWPDGGMGCPEKGMLYAQRLCEGYWVQLDVEGQAFDYRATRQGKYRLCVGSASQPGMPSNVV